jgi:hypothetical protein
VQLGSSFNSIATSIMIYYSDREFFGCLCGLVVNWGILLLMTFSINDFGSKNFNSVRTFWIALCFIPVQEAFPIVRPLLTVHSRYALVSSGEACGTGTDDAHARGYQMHGESWRVVLWPMFGLRGALLCTIMSRTYGGLPPCGSASCWYVSQSAERRFTDDKLRVHISCESIRVQTIRFSDGFGVGLVTRMTCVSQDSVDLSMQNA